MHVRFSVTGGARLTLVSGAQVVTMWEDTPLQLKVIFKGFHENEYIDNEKPVTWSQFRSKCDTLSANFVRV